MRTLLALGAALVLAAPALAQDQAGAAAEWTKVTTPDGSASVTIPCPSNRIKLDRVGADGFKLECQMDEHRFVVVAGLPSNTPEDNGRVNGFDAFVAKTKSPAISRYVKMDTIGKHRRLTIGCGEADGGMCMVIVDRGNKAPLAVGYAGDLEFFRVMPEAEQKAANAAIRGFVQSLEMHD